MSTDRIIELFEVKLASVAKVLGLKVAMENIEFKPPQGIYLRSHVLPAQTEGMGLAGTMQVYRGVYQVDVCAPTGSGKKKAGSIADSIIKAFPHNIELTSSDFSVYVNSVPSRFPGIGGDTLYIIPVSMSYRADTILE